MVSHRSVVVARLAFSVFCAILHQIVADTSSSDWGYRGRWAPAYWKTKYASCGQTQQSPVNIDTSEVVYDESLVPFMLTHTRTSKYNLSNKGQNIVIELGDVWKASIPGSRACYRPVSMHPHWGSTNYVGSEHNINNKKYPFEVHIVMWNCGLYKSAAEAISSVNGLAVIGVLYEIDNSASNIALAEITKALSLPKMKQRPPTGDAPSTDIPFFDLNLLLPHNRGFYRYRGSLTTPPCTENVLWSVMKHPMKMTINQLATFRRLLFSKNPYGADYNMVNNYRPVQPLNPDDPTSTGRLITMSGAETFVPKNSVTVLLASVSMFFVSFARHD